MSNKYRIFGKIPVADILIVALLIAVMAMGIWFIGQGDVQEETGAESQAEDVGESYPVTLTLSISNTSDKNEQLVSAGDELYYEDGTYFGKVTQATVEPYVTYYSNTAGGYTESTVEGRITIYMVVQAQATSRTDHGIYINGERVYLSDTVTLCNEKYYWNMTVVDIEREEAA